MRDSFTFKIGGAAGFGIMTTGLMFSKAATRSGFHIFDYVEYPSLIRGGHNVMETHFAKERVYSQEKGIDLLVALNRETFDFHKHELKDGSGVMYGPEVFELKPEDLEGKHVALIPVPLKKIIEETGILKIMENNITVGAAAALFGFKLEVVYSIIEDIFARKGEEVIIENKKAAQAGYQHIVNNGLKLPLLEGKDYHPSEEVNKSYAVISGNESVGMGALTAGLQFYVAYPMSPSSSLLHYMAAKAKHAGIVVRHAEDEIGVINEAIGASFAGARSMCGTSGGGFALMNEAVSLIGITETPMVVFIAQRPGPATGLPTWTEQGDLQYAIRSAHGEFPKIVFAPGDMEEAYELAMKALNMADKYQTVVILLSDKFLAESHQSVEVDKLRSFEVRVDRGKLELTPARGEQLQEYQRYKDSEDGISPRTIPGAPGFHFQGNSYEHVPDGHTTEDAGMRIMQVNKRFRKQAIYLRDDFQMPKTYGHEDADVAVVAWGTTKLPVLEALSYRDWNVNGKKVKLIHFTHMWPMDGDRVKELLEKEKQLVIIENNSQAQFAQLIRQETGIKIEKRLLKYDGRPIYPEEVLDFLNSI
ncbi:MAG: 2-oxoacid:acceptor oxidoreductase subunit alpha [Candidatus Roizmanbacteria bacterium]|nr:2-oxoacid:acceptor oxidoreductase subunit alpha [Candidatus Roizmanbacteria bacterium]